MLGVELHGSGAKFGIDLADSDLIELRRSRGLDDAVDDLQFELFEGWGR